tara:strand:+ start:1578 stop:3179 length:1602 start_codon:yes stop_codon:yes gene_type:complete
MSDLLDLLYQNQQRTNPDSLLSSRGRGGFRNIASLALGRQKKEDKRVLRYALGSLLLGIGDRRAQKRMTTSYNEFLLEDRGNRARLESDVDKYLSHQENLKKYTRDGKQDWKTGLKLEVAKNYMGFAPEVVEGALQDELNNFAKQKQEYAKGNFKNFTTKEEAMKGYDKLALKYAEKLNPNNAGMLKNVFGNIAGTREKADTVMQNYKTDVTNLLSAHSSGVKYVQQNFNVDTTKLYSTKKQLEQRVSGYNLKIADPNFKHDEDSLLEGYALGINPSGFPHLDAMLKHQLPQVLKVVEAAKAARAKGKNPLTFFEGEQLDIYTKLTGNNKEGLSFSETTALYSNDKLRDSADASINEYISKAENDNVTRMFGTLGSGKQADSKRSLFITNVLTSAADMQSGDPDTYGGADGFRKAIQESISLQVKGLYEKEKGTRALGTTWGGDVEIEYVDGALLDLPSTEATAPRLTEAFNTKRWLQTLKYQDPNGNTQTFQPQEGKEYIPADNPSIRYYTKEIGKDKNDQLIYAWSWELIT